MRRREFIAGLGGAAAWTLAAGAQQSAVPVIGLLNSSTFEAFNDSFAAFRRGLAESGYVEGRNVAFEYRMAENQFDRLPGLVDDLVRQRVSVKPAVMSVASCTAKSPAICRSNNLPGSSSRSISRLPKRSALPSRRTCSPSPTR
jgi:putative tryptophan/tyrosine transport system substrate-binding protein